MVDILQFLRKIDNIKVPDEFTPDDVYHNRYFYVGDKIREDLRFYNHEEDINGLPYYASISMTVDRKEISFTISIPRYQIDRHFNDTMLGTDSFELELFPEIICAAYSELQELLKKMRIHYTIDDPSEMVKSYYHWKDHVVSIEKVPRNRITVRDFVQLDNNGDDDHPEYGGKVCLKIIREISDPENNMEYQENLYEGRTEYLAYTEDGSQSQLCDLVVSRIDTTSDGTIALYVE